MKKVQLILWIRAVILEVAEEMVKEEETRKEEQWDAVGFADGCTAS